MKLLVSVFLLFYSLAKNHSEYVITGVYKASELWLAALWLQQTRLVRTGDTTNAIKTAESLGDFDCDFQTSVRGAGIHWGRMARFCEHGSLSNAPTERVYACKCCIERAYCNSLVTADQRIDILWAYIRHQRG